MAVIMVHALPADGRDELLAVLANEACRATLSKLRATTGSATALRALAKESHARDPGGTAVTPSRLHHVTPPKLDDGGLVDYDSVEQTVRYRPNERMEFWVDAAEDRGE